MHRIGDVGGGATLAGIRHARRSFPMITIFIGFLMNAPLCEGCKQFLALVEIGCFMRSGPVQAAFLVKAVDIVCDTISANSA